MRLFGAVMIFCACTLLGLSASAVYKRRVRQLEAFAMLIAYVGAQINAFLTPLDKIYASFENRTLDECAFLDALRRDGGVKALQTCRRLLSLTDGDISELEHFFEGLGRHSAQDEARHCAYFGERIGETLASARAEATSKGKVCRTLGALFGIMLAILLL